MVKYMSVFRVVFSIVLLSAFSLSAEQAKSNYLSLNVEKSFPIKDVIVYSDRASVKRSGALYLHKGLNKLSIIGLSPVLVENSLRLYWKQNAVELLSVFSYNDNLKNIKNLELRKLEKEKEQIENTILVKRRRVSVQKTLLSYLGKYHTYTQDVISGDSGSTNTVNTALWDKTLNFMMSKKKFYNSKLSLLKKEIKRLEESLKTVSGQIHKISLPASRKIRITEALLWSNQDRKIDLNISYIVYHCSWTPYYAARIKGQDLGIEYYAAIKQQTGENWKNIHLILSTAKPSKGLLRPKTYALRLISYKRRGEALQIGIKKEEKKSLKADKAIKGREIFDGNKKTKKLAGSVIFNIGSGINIPSGKKDRRVLITIIKTKTRDYRELHSALKKVVYTGLESSNNSSFPLLAGKMDIFKDAVYSGYSPLAFVSPGSDFKIITGTDNNIIVKRKSLPYKIEKNLLGSKKIYHKTIIISLQNLSKNSKTVNVVESIPVSLVEDFIVKLNGDKTSSYTEWDKKTGILKWTVKLKAGEKRNIILDYTVSTPVSYKGGF